MKHMPMISLLWAIGVPLALMVSGEDRFPGEAWEKAESPEAVGWSRQKLEAAVRYSETIDTAAVMVIQDGLVVYEWGETDRPFNCHSMRKSILSALYGIQVAEGRIDLDRNMGQLGIDDNEPSLSDREQQATVRQLLKARSAVYHAALYETAGMARARPRRWSHEAGTYWYYNNWDFNALGTIFENLTGRGIFEEFEDRFAGPLQMQDFVREEHTHYVTGADSVHPAYPFQLSARDLARFGLLFLRSGRWRDRQLVPEAWVTESTTSYSDAGRSGGYGYLWWIAKDGQHLPGAEIPNGSYTARGAGGHQVLVIPDCDIVLVHRVNTFVGGNSVSAVEFGNLAQMILEARPQR